MAPKHDYKAMEALLTQADHEFSRHGRLTKETYLALKRGIPYHVGDRMWGQLEMYRDPMMDYKLVDSLLDLTAWRAALRWARQGIKRNAIR